MAGPLAKPGPKVVARDRAYAAGGGEFAGRYGFGLRFAGGGDFRFAGGPDRRATRPANR